MEEPNLNLKDAFTGFHSKVALTNYLEKRLATVSLDHKTLSVIIIDLDNFKSINDSYGHLAGDDAIKHLAKVINAVLYGQHFVARYGGDEFVIAMYGDHQPVDSTRIAKNLQEAL